MNVLLVEDERKIADFVCAGFREQGFSVAHCDNGTDGFTHASHQIYDVIVLDIMLPGLDGISILKGLRNAGNTTPIILLTARNELDDRIEGLSLGADDYLAKPFFVEELIARIQALMRRVSGERQKLLVVGELSLDRISREVTWHGRTVDLTSREFNLIEYLMRSPGPASLIPVKIVGHRVCPVQNFQRLPAHRQFPSPFPDFQKASSGTSGLPRRANATWPLLLVDAVWMARCKGFRTLFYWPCRSQSRCPEAHYPQPHPPRPR